MIRQDVTGSGKRLLPAREKRTSFILATILCLSACLPAPARGQEHAFPTRPGIGPGDARHPVDMNALPWRAIGRVQTELGGRCTGFLLAPTIVETAAHCLYIYRTDRFILPRDVHFLRAYSRGNFSAHSRVKSFLIPPGYDPHREAETAGFDRATLFLSQPVVTPADVLRVTRQTPHIGDGVTLGGYEQDFGEIVISDTACHVTGTGRDGGGRLLITHDCDATRGSSGAPLLTEKDGQWEVIGVQVLANAGKGGAAASLLPSPASDTSP